MFTQNISPVTTGHHKIRTHLPHFRRGKTYANEHIAGRLRTAEIYFSDALKHPIGYATNQFLDLDKTVSAIAEIANSKGTRQANSHSHLNKVCLELRKLTTTLTITALDSTHPRQRAAQNALTLLALKLGESSIYTRMPIRGLENSNSIPLTHTPSNYVHRQTSATPSDLKQLSQAIRQGQLDGIRQTVRYLNENLGQPNTDDIAMIQQVAKPALYVLSIISQRLDMTQHETVELTLAVKRLLFIMDGLPYQGGTSSIADHVLRNYFPERHQSPYQQEDLYTLLRQTSLNRDMPYRKKITIRLLDHLP